jgi:hypothetical protein
MKTLEEKKEFALSQLAPYFADPSTCGYNEVIITCEYLTSDGRMCVAGKNMINPKGYCGDIDIIFEINDLYQDGIFKPEVVGILTNVEWKHMQSIHDTLALHPDNFDRLQERISRLNLFTYEELVERAESLKTLT